MTALASSEQCLSYHWICHNDTTSCHVVKAGDDLLTLFGSSHMQGSVFFHFRDSYGCWCEPLHETVSICLQISKSDGLAASISVSLLQMNFNGHIRQMIVCLLKVMTLHCCLLATKKII